MKVPTLTSVQSSNIQSVGFGNHGLFVRFAGGALYHYPDAPKAVHDEMLKAESIGGFFRDKVRGKFNHRKIDDA